MFSFQAFGLLMGYNVSRISIVVFLCHHFTDGLARMGIVNSGRLMGGLTLVRSDFIEFLTIISLAQMLCSQAVELPAAP